MKKIIILCALLFSSQIFAKEFDLSLFTKAFSTLAEYKESPYGIFATLKNIENISNGYHVNYFSAIGNFNDNDFIANRYELVSEEWVLKDDHWHIDQWLFALTPENKLTFYLHRKMIQTRDRQVLLLENIPESDERYDNKVDEFLIFWEKKVLDTHHYRK